MKTAMLIIGIDTGVNTGFAIWNKTRRCLDRVETMKIHEAMNTVRALSMFEDTVLLVRVEDARQREWFGKAGKEQLQGAGSIKRDATIWEDFLKDYEIPFEMVAPKNNKTKLTDEAFKKLTKWDKRTSVHARDAALLVFGY